MQPCTVTCHQSLFHCTHTKNLETVMVSWNCNCHKTMVAFLMGVLESSLMLLKSDPASQGRSIWQLQKTSAWRKYFWKAVILTILKHRFLIIGIIIPSYLISTFALFSCSHLLLFFLPFQMELFNIFPSLPCLLPFPIVLVCPGNLTIFFFSITRSILPPYLPSWAFLHTSV